MSYLFSFILLLMLCLRASAVTPEEWQSKIDDLTKQRQDLRNENRDIFVRDRDRREREDISPDESRVLFAARRERMERLDAMGQQLRELNRSLQQARETEQATRDQQPPPPGDQTPAQPAGDQTTPRDAAPAAPPLLAGDTPPEGQRPQGQEGQQGGPGGGTADPLSGQRPRGIAPPSEETLSGLPPPAPGKAGDAKTGPPQEVPVGLRALIDPSEGRISIGPSQDRGLGHKPNETAVTRPSPVAGSFDSVRLKTDPDPVQESKIDSFLTKLEEYSSGDVPDELRAGIPTLRRLSRDESLTPELRDRLANLVDKIDANSKNGKSPIAGSESSQKNPLGDTALLGAVRGTVDTSLLQAMLPKSAQEESKSLAKALALDQAMSSKGSAASSLMGVFDIPKTTGESGGVLSWLSRMMDRITSKLGTPRRSNAALASMGGGSTRSNRFRLPAIVAGFFSPGSGTDGAADSAEGELLAWMMLLGMAGLGGAVAGVCLALIRSRRKACGQVVHARRGKESSDQRL